MKAYGWNERNADQRNIPVLDNYADFLRAYIEIHSTLDYSVRYKYKNKKDKYKALRLRIYGNYIFINSINYIMHDYAKTSIKSIQVMSNGKTACLYFSAYPEIKSIFDFISGEPCYHEFWKYVDMKLRTPILNYF